MKLKPYSSTLLALAGIIIAGMGLYFIFLRPSLLPEDIRYMDTTLQNIKENIPGLLNWLQKVFWVMGGYIFTTGLLTVFIALTIFRTRANGAFIIIAIAGLTSIGFMTGVNFIINSDFKWMLFAFTSLWLFAIILYRFHK